MSTMTTVSARIKADVKSQAESIMETVGISHSTAINALYAQIVLQGGMPFELRVPQQDGALSFYSILNAVRQTAPKYGIERVSLFGSYARGDARSRSDVDLCVDKGTARGFAIGGFQYDVSQELGKEVDVVIRSAMDASFAERIAKDEVVLYERQRT